MRTINLTKNLVTIVDDEDYLLFNNYKWYASGRVNIYAVRDILINGKKKSIRLHREILSVKTTNFIVDHINGNTLDNRKSNLRICLQKENMRNQKRKSTNTSGFKGVSYRKRDNTWRARIMLDYKEVSLGTFKTKKSAAKAYNDAALKLHGKFAKLNEV